MSKHLLKPRTNNLEDGNAIKSIRIVEKRYTIELAAKSLPGFLQYFSINPFTIALWT